MANISELFGQVDTLVLQLSAQQVKTAGDILIRPNSISPNGDTLHYQTKLSFLYQPLIESSSDYVKIIRVDTEEGYRIQQIVRFDTLAYSYHSGQRMMIPVKLRDTTILLSNYRMTFGENEPTLWIENRTLWKLDLPEAGNISLSYHPYVGNLFNEVTLITNGQRSAHRLGDVLKLGPQPYRLSEIDPLTKRLTLIADHSPAARTEGFTTGKIVPDYPEIYRSLTESLPPTTDTLTNRATLYHFWGHWCLPCIKHAPQTKRLFGKIDPKRVRIIDVAAALPKYSDAEMQQGIEQYGCAPESIIDRGELTIQPLRVSSYPSYLLIAPDGTILFRGTGAKTETDLTLLQACRALDFLKN